MSSASLGFPAPQLDLAGKLIIKARLGDDIRQIPIHNEEITYDELLLMMQRLFRGKIKGSDDIVIKYKDADGDLITIFDSSDLSFAKSLNRHLKVTLFVNGKPRPLESDQVKEIRNELISIRDTVNDLLSRLQSYSDAMAPLPTPPSSHGCQATPVSTGKDMEKPMAKVPGSQTQATVSDSKAHAALFDPLKNEADSTSNHSKDPFSVIGHVDQQGTTMQGSSQDAQSAMPTSVNQPQQHGYSAPAMPTGQYQAGMVATPASVPASMSMGDAVSQSNLYGSQAGYYEGQGVVTGYHDTGSRSTPQQVITTSGIPYDKQQVQQPQQVGYASQGGQQQQPGAYYAAPQAQYNVDAAQQAPAQQQMPQLPNQPTSLQQQQYASQGNPYSRSVAPRQQYPTPSQGYEMYYQSQGGQQQQQQQPTGAAGQVGYTGLPG